MSYYIGVDIGTSAAKFLLADEMGNILNQTSAGYPVRYFGVCAEQDPADWLEAVKEGVSRLLDGFDKSQVKGLGIDGQMHGAVVLDGQKKVIRPCILWNDGRSFKETEFLNDGIGRRVISGYTANIAYAGFTAPKLMWLKEHEKANFDRIRRLFLPKDYIVYELTGEEATDFSDASGTLLLDVEKRDWSGDMCRLTGIDRGILPRLFESFAPVGKLKRQFEELWGVKNVTVCAGAGDNAAAAVGTGAVFGGKANISLGTSGTLFISADKFAPQNEYALHNFCHANGRYHLLGCILSAASCAGWWMNVLGTDDFDGEQDIPDDMLAGDVFFLPYLSGERSPHNDPFARGAFLGLGHGTDRRQMTAAVLEGVAYALKDCVEAAKKSGVKITSSAICGGGAKSRLWKKIVANVCDIKLEVPALEGPAFGAAILAMTAYGEYKSVEEACKAITRIKEVVTPDAELKERYAGKYKKFKKFYPALKGLF